MPLARTTPTRARLRLPARRVVTLCFGLALLLPALAARTRVATYADALGDQIAVELAAVLAPVSAARTPASPDLSLADVELAAATPGFCVAIATQQGGAHGAKRGAKSNPGHALRISSAQVLSLVARRAMPDAAPVRASADHPAGLQLRAVSALGVGLQEGDVLTEAAGQRASSVAAVIGAVLAARARHSPEISGRFFRAGVPYLVTVEQPYPPGT